MIDYYSFSAELSEATIKNIKGSIKTQWGLIIINILVVIFNFCALCHDKEIHLFAAIITGTLICNIFWCLINLQSYKIDLKLEKEMLNRIRIIKEERNFENILKSHEQEIESYRDHIRYLELNLKTNVNVAFPENKPPVSTSPEGEK